MQTRSLLRGAGLLLSLGVVGCEPRGPVTERVVAAPVPFSRGASMNKREFWRLLTFAKQQAAGNEEVQEALLVQAMAHYSADDIIEFECLLRQCLEEADDFRIIAAEKIIEGSVTDDSHLYFRCWLVMQGEQVFTEAVRNPDSLAGVDTDGIVTEFEPLLYVATTAYKAKTGKQEEDGSFPRDRAAGRGLDYDSATQPKGQDWTAEQLPALLPRLWAKYD